MKLLRFLLLFLIIYSTSFAQRRGPMGPGGPHSGMFGSELFLYNIYQFADITDESQTRVDIHISLVNDILTFIKTDENSYNAEYEINFIIYNKKNEALTEQHVKNKVSVGSFIKTNDRTMQHKHMLSTLLKPGKYRYVLRLIDADAKHNIMREDELEIKSFAKDRLQLSDLVFIDAFNEQNDSITYQPNLMNTFNKINSAFACYFEIYNPTPSDSIHLFYKIKNAHDDLIYQENTVRSAGHNVLPQILSFKQYLSKPGEYNLTIKVQQGNQHVELDKNFNVNWANLGVKKANLQVAIEQLRLIAHKKTIDQIQEAPENEQQKLYDEFWKERDPTPETTANELKQEFFFRIDFANKNFTEVANGREGWMTDRGRIYIKNGPPDQLDRQPTQMNMPAAEIWYYQDINRRYIFSDRRGTGEYRLVREE